MTNYPLCEKLGLIWGDDQRIWVGELEQIFACAQRVYSIAYIPKGSTCEQIWSNAYNKNNDTHTALLLCVEGIKPKECEHHDPGRYYGANQLTDSAITCVNCGKKLKANWTVEE